MRLNKKTTLSDGRKLCAWWANNAGRGNSNCTLAVVPGATERAVYSRQQADVIATTTTSSWRGDVNLSRAVRETLGIAGLTFEKTEYRWAPGGGGNVTTTRTRQ